MAGIIHHICSGVPLDPEAFLTDLNNCVAFRNQRERHTPFADFEAADLTKLAYWMATGSGKTLLMHINYHQINHYRQLAHRHPYKNILLITPNAGLSRQHLAELRLSNIPAHIYPQTAPDTSSGAVQIIEITKFAKDTSGLLTVSIKEFEGPNLVFVDEGHRGASGDVWFGYRDKLAENGFTFEYSATFGEALNKGNTPADRDLRHTYGKTIIFDYSYRYFHGDGYGKDYTILNLPHSYHTRDRDTLLLANLLTLYEQTYVYLEHRTAMRDYHIERPLLMFVGHTVQTGKTRSQLGSEDKVSLSDVLDITRFLHRLVHDRAWAEDTITAILNGQSGLTDQHGVDIFHTKFPVLRGHLTIAEIYTALLSDIFQAEAPGPLHLANLRSAAGEISLRVGTSEIPFGVINIGDDANFLNMAAQKNLGLVIDPDDALRTSLFATINRPDSTVNLLVGAKKFAEGWSSWRVSGMGLLNVGRSEGSEVIQMFGRGVRLLGYQRSLQRSAYVAGAHPHHLPLLETLNIFSINGDYLAQFKQALSREGIIEGYEEIQLPIRFDTFDTERPDLYVLRPAGLDFNDQPAFVLAAVDNLHIRPELDFTSRVQITTSLLEENLRASHTPVFLSKEVRDVLDWDTILLELRAWRRQCNFRNLVIHPAALREILTPDEHNITPYYTLYAPNDLVTPRTYADIPRIQHLALAILKKYIERFYRYHQQQWEAEHNLEYRLLDKTDDNMLPDTLTTDDDPPQHRAGYIIKVNQAKPDLIAAVRDLVEQGDAIYQQTLLTFNTPDIKIIFDRHLYIPLLRQYPGGNGHSAGDIKSVPVGLNKGEADFVEELRRHLQTAPLNDHRLYLLRNLSRGKGVSFFDGENFYPDFILWLVSDHHQAITFIDPKGLALLHPDDFTHPKVQLFRRLQEEIAPRVTPPPNTTITLDSYIISTEHYNKTRNYFARGADPNEFLTNHILFPGSAAGYILDALKKQFVS